MELKELVNQTLTGIIEGVMAAQEQCKEYNAVICPGKVGPKNMQTDYSHQKVQFNIVLGGEIESGTSNGLRVSFPQIGINIGTSTDENKKNSEQTSVSFTVPVMLPVQKKKR